MVPWYASTKIYEPGQRDGRAGFPCATREREREREERDLSGYLIMRSILVHEIGGNAQEKPQCNLDLGCPEDEPVIICSKNLSLWINRDVQNVHSSSIQFRQ
ncbi:PREDICTED: uncharacterized protein LOC105448605 [Wasmannia auropunctata]|uniref:uncharacterized protein LOC105448605 n=1 Tax=Wasmannia auropunctata TaxID=64793 RepID=UPI0005EDC3E8|nr:PREDICTED: uncharacterized protein LOC105448605 [Wasmannia auropunctata]